MSTSTANDELGSNGQNLVPGPVTPSEDVDPGAAYINVSLKRCMQSLRNAATTKKRGKFESTTRQVLGGEGCFRTADLVEEDMGNRSSPMSSAGSLSGASGPENGPGKEARRLKVLKSYLGVLDCDHGNKFERLTALACRIFRVPMALVTITDVDKQYCISSRGLDYTSSTKKSLFCSNVLSEDCDVLVVTDAASDPRFSYDPEVTGYPNFRFWAGVPLVCPEGYKLGTLCVMDNKPRFDTATLEDKQSLIELSSMAMETLVSLRKKKHDELMEPSQQIACTAHDLLTPLTGIALTLSLLKEDEGLQRKLSEQQRDMIETAANCSTVMNSICHKTMDFFRDRVSLSRNLLSKRNEDSSIVKVSDLVKNLNMVMEPLPKKVPITITVDSAVPPQFVSDDMKIFRSATNFLTNSCAKTESGSIHCRIFSRKNIDQEQELVFQCEDTGPGIDVAKYAYLFKPFQKESNPVIVSENQSVLESFPSGACPKGLQNIGLGLYSVATQITSIGGKYGFRPREEKGSIFWFAVPLIVPQNHEYSASLSNADYASKGIDSMGQKTSNIKNAAKVEVDMERRARLLGIKPDIGTIYTQPSQASSAGKLKRGLDSGDALEVHSLKSKPSLSMQNLKNLKNFSISSNRAHQALVIEDSLVVRKSLARALSKLGFEVTQANNGMEGLKELKASLFDLVLCDFLMPVMDGLDCIQQYRQWEKVSRPYFRQYIVGISAHAGKKDADQGFKVGMDDFRPKPVTYKELTDLKNGNDCKLKSLELDQLGHEIDCLKLQKKAQLQKMTPFAGSMTNLKSISTPPSANEPKKVCLVVDESNVISKLAKLVAENIGWKIVAVGDPESALGLLKMRNWDAVLVDDELGCSRSIAIFRGWEQSHRVNRQKNVILISANHSSQQQFGSSFQAPTGFDGALGKPIQLNTLKFFLETAQTGCDIVMR